MEINIKIFILITIITTSTQIYIPDEEVNRKPVAYSSGIKTFSYHRPSQLNIDHNYSKVYHPNGQSANSLDDEEDSRQLYPVYNAYTSAHTYGSRPQSAKLTQVYVLDGTRIQPKYNPTRQVLIYNKAKRTPKAEAFSSCPHNATGQFIYEGSCNQFLNCWKGRGHVQNCAPGTLFNPKTQECDFPEKVHCISGPRQGIIEERNFRSVQQVGCPKDFSGLIPNYTDCSKFINCVSGIENFMDCPRGTLFDIDKNICDFAYKANCFNKENQNLVEQNVDQKLDESSDRRENLQYKRNENRYNEIRCPEGAEGLFKHPTDCSKFLNCANGQTFIQECAPGTLFNLVIKICDFPYNVICQNTQSSTGIVDYNTGPYRNQSIGYYGEDSHYTPGRDYNQASTDSYGNAQGTYFDHNHLGRGDPDYHGQAVSIGGTTHSTSGNDNFGQNYHQGTHSYNNGRPTFGGSSGQNNLGTDQNYHQGSHSYNNGQSISVKGSSRQNHLGSDGQNYNQGTYSHDAGQPTFVGGNSGIYSSGQNNLNRDGQNYHQGTYSYKGQQPVSTSGQGSVDGNGQNFHHTGYANKGQITSFDGQTGRNEYRPYPTGSNYDDSSNQYGQSSIDGGASGHGVQPINNEYGRPSGSSSSGYYIPSNQGSRRPDQVYPASPYRPTQTINGQESGSHNHRTYPNNYQEPDSYDRTSLTKGTYITRDSQRPDSYDGTYVKGTYITRNPTHQNGGYYSSETPNFDGSTNTFYNQRPSQSNNGRTDTQWTGEQRPFGNNYDQVSNFDGNTNNLYNQRPKGTRHTSMYNGRTQPEGTQDQRPSYDNTQYGNTQQGQRGDTGYTQWNNQQNKNLDEDSTPSNYDQVVNINHYRKTTPVPYRNSYEPFFGTTKRAHTSQVNDYVDYVPGTPKFQRSTSPTVEKNWPPPFPSTDVNADYVFENEDDRVPLEAENAFKDNECSKNTFSCSSEKCISKMLVCNGVKDCPNGEDEKKCIEHVAKFSIQKNKKLAILEKERWDNVSIAACALMCAENQKLRCRSFNYRKVDKACFLSSSNEGLTGAIISYYPFDYYERINERIDCSNMYVCSNKKCVDKKKICDGFDDCGDRMDEKGCKPESFGYSVRLTGSKNKNEGSVEVTAFGKSGFVCDDTFKMRDANVICKELGFQLGASEVKGNSYFTKEVTDEKPFYMMDDVNCQGNETRLLDCDFSGWGVHNCLGQEVVGVVCKTPAEKCADDYWKCDTKQECLPLAFVCDGLLDCTDGSDEGTQHCDAPTLIRLANGTAQSEGRLEIKHHGTWGTVCDDDFNEDAAKVVCRQLGYKGSAVVKKEAYFGSGSGPIWLDQVFCSGNESSVEGCTHWDWGEHNCEHSEDVGLICSNVNDFTEKHSQSVLLPIWRPPVTYPERCGFRSDSIFNRNDDVHFRVVKASVAKKGDYPWQAAIRVKGKTTTSHWCGAVVISEKFVLTAAHCLIGYSKGAYVIIAGDYNVDEDEGTEQEANIEDFYLHEDFRKGHKMNNDIALVKLKGRGFQLNDHVQPICLPDEDTSYETDQNCTISGFGSIESGKSAFSHNLRAGWVPLQKRDICKMPHVYGNAMTDGMVCAGSLDEGVDSCDGDSGGPLACLYNGVFTLYGITSWGQHCGYANKPGVYVKVAHYRKWIDDNFKKYSE